MIKKYFIFIFLITSVTLFSQTNPLKPKETDDKLLNILSPTSAVEGANGISKYSPISSLFNPATNSLKKQVTFEAVFGWTMGTATTFMPELSTIVPDPHFGIFGYNGGIGLTIPSESGSFNFNGLIAYNDSADLYIRPSGILSFSYSNLISPNLSIGGGIKTILSENSKKSFIFSLTGDFGIIWAPKNIKNIDNLYVEASLNNLGYGTLHLEPESFGITPLTLKAGLKFSFFKNDLADLNFFATASLPAFQNLILTPGFDFAIKNIFNIRISSTLNAIQIKNKDISGLIPAFGMYVNISIPYDEKNSYPYNMNTKFDFSTKAFRPKLWNSNLSWTIQGGREIDVLSYSDKTFLSVNIDKAKKFYDGLIFEPEELLLTMKEKDRVILIPNSPIKLGTLPVEINFSTSKKFKSVLMLIENSDKEIVYKKQLDFESIKDIGRGLSQIEESWNGRDSNSLVCPKGIYAVYAKATDEANNQFYSQKEKFYVNKDLGFIKVYIDDIYDSIFSTDIKNTNSDVTLKELGSIEKKWNYVIYNEFLGEIKKGEFINTNPPDFTWDGKTDKNIKVPDGVYNYKIWTTTQSKNYLEAIFESIIVNNDYDSLKLNIKNGLISRKQGPQRPIEFAIFNEHLKNISWWALQILDNEGKVYYSKKFNTNTPEIILYDNTENRSNKSLNVGKYRGRVIIAYENGNIKTGISDEFDVID